MTLILPSSVERVIPDWFARMLKEVDPALTVYFNPIRQRWVIDRCTRDDNTLHTDHRMCPRTNVLLVQGDEGEYMPLCDAVIEKLKANDVWSNHGSAEGLMKHLQTLDDENQERLRKARKENTEHATRDNRQTLNKAAALVDTVTGYEIKQ